MKKSLLVALTGALVVGATATTFAAANPFSDVPAGHWAYNSVTKLAGEGVIEGYGDGTYRGNRNITRYEMAQMIARALAKAPSTNMSAASRAELDKLAAEFRDELDSLGVRVEELEKHADKVKWAGKIEYTYNHHKYSGYGYGKEKDMTHNGVFRLEPTAEINDHWTAHARFDASYNGKEDSTGDAKLKRVYAQGDYDKFGVKLGRFGFCPSIEDGIVADTVVSGAELSFGSKWKFTVTAGRIGANSDEAHYDYNNADVIYDSYYNPAYKAAYEASILAGNTVAVAENDGTNAGLNAIRALGASTDATAYETAYATAYANAYTNAYNAAYANAIATGSTVADATTAAVAAGVAAGDAAGISAGNAADYVNGVAETVNIGGNAYPTDVLALNVRYDDPGDKGLFGGVSYYYAKDKDFKNYFYNKTGERDKASIFAVGLGYRFNENLKLWGSYARNGKADNQKDAWAVDLRYGTYGDYAEKGDWAVWAGYAKFGANAAIASNQGDDIVTGQKGWHVGVGYAPFKNVGLQLRYANGKIIDTQLKDRHFWARAEFFF